MFCSPFIKWNCIVFWAQKLFFQELRTLHWSKTVEKSALQIWARYFCSIFFVVFLKFWLLTFLCHEILLQLFQLYLNQNHRPSYFFQTFMWNDSKKEKMAKFLFLFRSLTNWKIILSVLNFHKKYPWQTLSLYSVPPISSIIQMFPFIE